MLKTLYRRILPSPPAIDVSSSEGKRIFREALDEGTMELFFKMFSCYQTQLEPTFCGPGTLSVVLNTLAIDPQRKWKGIWRWYDDTMVASPEFLKTVETNGLTFDQFADLARGNRAKVSAFRNGSIESFRKRVLTCSSTDSSCMVISYDRKVLKQLGEGHFSPIGGYHSKEDWVLILDVARFKYPPHWVPLNLVWDAINTLDDATGRSRGYIILSRLDEEGEITSSS